MNTIRVKASREYDVCVAEGILQETGERVRAVCPKARLAAIVSDQRVMALYGDSVSASLEQAGFSVVRFAFPEGEQNKTLSTYGEILNFLSRSRLTRGDVVVALGGGVVGDIAGFAASTYLRGIDYVQLPTTLLSAVDSSVGGKTAIDLDAGKNQAGTFAQPVLVLCDPFALSTLSEDDYRDGCAEVIKYGLLGNRSFFRELAQTPARDMLAHVITTCVTMKRDLVEGDEFDFGKRRFLNLGHSVAHAVEVCSGYMVSHGSAVAIGMATMTRAALKKGYCKEETLDDVLSILKLYQLPVSTAYGLDELCEAMRADKKMSSGSMDLIVPEEIGRCRIETVAQDAVRDWLSAGGIQ